VRGVARSAKCEGATPRKKMARQTYVNQRRNIDSELLDNETCAGICEFFFTLRKPYDGRSTLEGMKLASPTTHPTDPQKRGVARLRKLDKPRRTFVAVLADVNMARIQIKLFNTSHKK
jgi:hypothetical protein